MANQMISKVYKVSGRIKRNSKIYTLAYFYTYTEAYNYAYKNKYLYKDIIVNCEEE